MRKSLIIFLFLTGCIGEDIIFDEVQPEIRITNPLISIEISTSYQFEFMMINNIGEEVIPDMMTWSSSDETKLTIDNSGLANAVDYGTVMVTVNASHGTLEVEKAFELEITDGTVTMPTSRIGTVASTSSYKLQGDFELRLDGDNLILELADNYEASTALPGLFVYLSNNANSSASAYEIGAVTQFNGAHSYTIQNVGLYDYQYVLYFCKPFNVKVGHGEIVDP